MQTKKFPAYIAWLPITIVFFCGQTTASFAQTAKSVCDYECVSGQIKARVNLLVQYQTAKDYNQMFDLMRFDEKVARDDFISTEKSADEVIRSRDEIEYCEFVGFRTQNISILEPDRKFALVSGCVTCKKGSKTIFMRGQVEAVFTDDNWFFNGSIVGNNRNGLVACKKSK